MYWLPENIGGPATLVFVGAITCAIGGLRLYFKPTRIEQQGWGKAWVFIIFMGASISATGALLGDHQRKQFERATLSSVTGGDSFCYVKLIFQGKNPNRPHLIVIHQGKYPLYDVHIRIVDEQKWNLIGKVDSSMEALAQAESRLSIGNLSVNQVSVVGRWEMPNTQEKRYNIFISARNGFITELLRLRRVNDEWKWAIRVTRGFDGNEVLLEEIEPEFPRNQGGQVQW